MQMMAQHCDGPPGVEGIVGQRHAEVMCYRPLDGMVSVCVHQAVCILEVLVANSRV